MPKIKTKRGAAKRFRQNASGGFKCGSAHRRHILTKKSTKRKRHLRSARHAHPADTGLLRQMMPNG